MIPNSSILSNLQVLFEPGDTIELRCVGNRTINGFYRDLAKLAQDAETLNTDFSPKQNVYVCLNPVLPELYGRRADQFGPADRGGSVKDDQVTCRRWLLVDVDPVRPSGASATNTQKQAAEAVASQVYSWLCERLGPDCLVCGDSGNGSHILIRLPDLPVDNQTRWVCEHLLKILDAKFSNGQSHVDVSTYNAARISTCYSTTKRKGSSIPEQPHRQSKLVLVPDQLQPADWNMLANLVDPYLDTQQQQTPSNVPGLIDVPQLLADRQIAYSQDDQYQTKNGEIATRYELEECPFNAEHIRSSAIIRWPSNGAISFTCRHNGCSDKDWLALQQLWQLPASSTEITAADIIFAPTPSAGLAIVRSVDVTPEPIDWLWQDRVVVGGINLFAGRGGIGKTYFLCDLVARITNPALVAPNGQSIRHGKVLYATGEDHLAKIIEPRMQKHGADRSQLDYLQGVPAGPYVQLLNVVEHCNLLRDALRERPDTAALVLDPISCFQGAADSNKSAQVRQFTAVLTQLAEEFDIAILGIHHFNKGKRDVAGDSISGSHSYRDAARSIWLFALDADDQDRRLMVSDKCNWSEQRPDGLAYRIIDGVIQYEREPLAMTSDELMSQGTEDVLAVACAWLTAFLSAGSRAATDVLAAAAIEGITDATLRRAKKQIGVESQRSEGTWKWTLGASKEG